MLSVFFQLKISNWQILLEFCVKACTSQWTRVKLNSNRPASVMCRPDLILCRLGFNFESAARLFTVPGLLQAYFTYPTSLVQCDILICSEIQIERNIERKEARYRGRLRQKELQTDTQKDRKKYGQKAIQKEETVDRQRQKDIDRQNDRYRIPIKFSLLSSLFICLLYGFTIKYFSPQSVPSQPQIKYKQFQLCNQNYIF